MGFYLWDGDLLMDANGIVLGRATYSAWGSVLYSMLPQWWGRTTWWNKIDGVFTQVGNPFAP